jgi:hypothetical protein
MIFATDKFETNAIYPVNANLFVSETGMLTTRSQGDNFPPVGIVLAPPSPIAGMGFLEAMWL